MWGPMRIASMVALFTGAVCAQPIGILLTTSADPSTSITVTWLDRDAESGDRVWWKGIANDWRPVEGRHHAFGVLPTDLVVHRAVLAGLSPGKFYEFVVGEQRPRPYVERLRFRTPHVSPARPFRFVVGGDMYDEREWLDAMNRLAGRLDPELVVLGGDLAYANGTHPERWAEWMESWFECVRAPDGRLIPMVTAIGNHEIRRGEPDPRTAAAFFLSLFRPADAATYQAVDIGRNVSFLLLDTDLVEPVGGAQTEWLDACLREREDVAHVFAAYHNPAWGTLKPPRGARDPSLSEDAAVLHRHWLPLFERHPIAAAFEHDHHAYKRTWPLREGRIDQENGILYLGDGAWGVRERAAPSAESLWYLRRSERKRHLIEVSLLGDERRYRALSADGVVFDEWPERVPTRDVVQFSVLGPVTESDLGPALEIIDGDERSEFFVCMNANAVRDAAALREGDLPRYVLARGEPVARDKGHSAFWETVRRTDGSSSFAFVHKGVQFVGLARARSASEWLAESLGPNAMGVRAAVVFCGFEATEDLVKRLAAYALQARTSMLIVTPSREGWQLTPPDLRRPASVLRVGPVDSDHPPVLVRVDDVAEDPFRFERRRSR